MELWSRLVASHIVSIVIMDFWINHGSDLSIVPQMARQALNEESKLGLIKSHKKHPSPKKKLKTNKKNPNQIKSKQNN